MIIAIDGYEANVKNRVGIGRYAYEIICGIYRSRKSPACPAGQAKVDSFVIYLPDQPLPDLPPATDWWMYRIAKPKKFWTLIGLPLALYVTNPKPNVIFSPTHYVPRFTNTPRVMAIMDLSYLKFPALFRGRDLHKLVRWTKYSASCAKAIFAISHFSRNDIINAYRVDPKQVVVTYPGLMKQASNVASTKLSASKRQASSMGVDKKYNIDKHYILSVGTIQPRKNYTRLIAAFSEFLKANKQRFGEIDLVIIGKKGWMVEDILEAPKKFKVEDRVKFLDFVPDNDLPALYRGALCFALPSLYEGFGLPVLEAMACGCPVVVSRVSSLPEIAGEAGIYVDPASVESITKGLLTAVGQRNLMQGKIRVKKGLEQVKKFSWDTAAKQTIEVLTAVGKGHTL